MKVTGRDLATRMSPARPSNVWNERSERTGLRSFDPERPWYAFADELLDDVAFPEGGRALDLGCGMGEFLQVLEERGLAAFGVEGNADQARAIRERGLGVGLADLEAPLPFSDATFDLVTCLEVIEHVAQADGLMEEIRRVLKPGGHLVLSTPNFAFLNYRIRYLIGRPPFEEGIHLRYFTRSTLEACIRRHHLEVVRENSFAPFPLVDRLGLRSRVWRPQRFSSVFSIDLVLLARKG